MHDTSALDRPPLDATKLPQTDAEIQALLNGGGAPVIRPARRRFLAPADFTGLEPAKEHHPEVAPAEGQGGEDASEVATGSIEAILAERGKTHGDFTDNARVTQALKRIVHAEVGWDKLTDVQREALHMILHKVGRIISGNPNTQDHWDDIAGYAKLVSERIT